VHKLEHTVGHMEEEEELNKIWVKPILEKTHENYKKNTRNIKRKETTHEEEELLEAHNCKADKEHIAEVPGGEAVELNRNV
jgi:hypothetical protein